MNKSISLIVILILIHSFTGIAQTSIITTFAGTGIDGDSGDGGPALSASFSYPCAMTIVPGGEMYVCDRQNNKVKKIAIDGTITTIAGNGAYGFSNDGGAATNAELEFPGGVTVNNAGDVFVADINNNRIRTINSAGIINTIAGTGTMGYNGDNIPATAAMLMIPYNLATDGSNIYFADAGNNRIRVINAEDGKIYTVAGNGVSGYSGDGSAATDASLNFPTGVALDKQGNLYIADFSNSSIRKVNKAGIITTIAGNGTDGNSGDGGAATSALLHHPSTLTIDKNGNIHFIDDGNNRVRKIDTSGTIVAEAGTGVYGFTGDDGPAISATLKYPGGIALDAAGSIYISDEQNFRIRKIYSPSLGIQHNIVGEQHLNIFPNPAATSISVQLPKGTNAGVLKICNATGLEVIRSNITENLGEIQLDISTWSNGMYFISYTDRSSGYNNKFTKIQ